jgi:hypothetical protein
MSDLKENWYWVLPAKLMAGGYPGASDVDDARRGLAAIVECGATYFIDLTEEHSPLVPYHALLPEIGRAHGTVIGYEHFPIPEGEVPESPEFTRTILDRIDAIVGGAVPYVHGRQGVGRAGTIL